MGCLACNEEQPRVTAGLSELGEIALAPGLPRDPAEPGELARRYPLLRDAQTFVGESQKRPSPIANLLESVKQFSTETQTQSETGVHYRCL